MNNLEKERKNVELFIGKKVLCHAWIEAWLE